ncbi:maleylpyruvate isomerase family mycothiol-dependent enzyme [Streptomyces werraensis]|uniref:maleylpyruvate isomerase family mycothiol-dependent enzyme n=1 Tax=Streptomyces werraensis TaxID=68284 RepID=UPI001CE2561B
MNRSKSTEASRSLAWVKDGTARVAQHASRLAPAEFAVPTRLPGWSRAHLLAHLARNAEALTNLTLWARTGVEIPMYKDAGQRDRDIQQSAGQAPPLLLADFSETAAVLEASVSAMDATAWAAEVRTARGRAIPASEIPWLRAREVWIHLVDLDAGFEMEDLPADFVDALLDDVGSHFTGRKSFPTLRIEPTDRQRAWQIGDSRSATVVTAPAATALGWLIGRREPQALTAPSDLPSLPSWL